MPESGAQDHQGDDRDERRDPDPDPALAQDDAKIFYGWAPKPVPLTQWKAPNKPIWRLSEIMAAHKDAVALSRSSMPPGDPILQVRAPSSAQQVTAYFPFGLVKDLVYDADAEHWRVRFLVPKGVVDGVYEVKIVIVHADGTIEVARIPYTIDSSEMAAPWSRWSPPRKRAWSP